MCRIAFRLVLLLVASAMTSAAEYPRPGLLVEPETLAKMAPAKNWVVLDARPQADFEAGHIPGARWVDAMDWAKQFGEGQDRTGWSERLGKLGLTPDTPIVLYDDSQSKDAARIWWILRYWGTKDVRLLNGGWRGWKTADFKIEKPASAFAATQFPAKPIPERLTTQAELLEALPSGRYQIIDARSSGEFCGTEPLKNKRAGSIPDAIHLDWVDLVDRETHRFKSPQQLEPLFKKAGIQLDRPTATYCQSGGRASVMAFGLELMGAKDVQNYYKSWSDWSSSDATPIAKPIPKKR